jgi:hypothetical protein
VGVGVGVGVAWTPVSFGVDVGRGVSSIYV